MCFFYRYLFSRLGEFLRNDTVRSGHRQHANISRCKRQVKSSGFRCTFIRTERLPKEFRAIIIPSWIRRWTSSDGDRFLGNAFWGGRPLFGSEFSSPLFASHERLSSIYILKTQGPIFGQSLESSTSRIFMIFLINRWICRLTNTRP